MFWEKYCSLCTAIGKAPNVVAAEIGIKSSGSVTGWKNGAIPRAGILQKLADYFGCEISDLVDDNDKKTPVPDWDERDEEFNVRFRALPEEQKEWLLAQLRGLAKE